LRLHGKGHRAADADGVQAVAVAELVELGDGLDVVDEAHGAEGAQRLVLGPGALDPGEGAAGHLHLAAAGDGAAAAGVIAGEDGLGHVRARDLGGALRPAPLAPVLDGQVADALKGLQAAAGAVIVHALGVLANLGHRLAHGGGQTVGVIERRARPSAGDDGFELFRAHHRAQPGAPGRPARGAPGHDGGMGE